MTTEELQAALELAEQLARKLLALEMYNEEYALNATISRLNKKLEAAK